MFYLSSLFRSSLVLLCLFILSSNCWADLAQETIYLTWKQSPATTMTIQWISLSRDKQSVVNYKFRNSDNDWEKITGDVLGFPQASQYLIHTVELKNLRPDTEYVFKVLPYKEEYHFLTAPAQLEKELKFVVGGDMYHDDISFLIKTCQRAAQTSPLFALIGGDIAYAVKSQLIGLQRIDRWIDWIKAWHKYMVTPQGDLIPVICAIGNHDLNGGFDQTPTQAAIFSTLFPMPGKQVYNILDFNPYLTVFILDSGHANPIAGRQTDWLRSTLRERQQMTHRIAIYHVPGYPSVRDFKNKYSTAIRTSWVPLFEQWGVQAVFENHDHVYKRTYPLLKDQPHPEGIVYLGDGGWGVEKPRTLRWKSPYIAKFSSVRHFIFVTLTSTKQQFKCINDQGQVLDEYTQSIKRNKPLKENPQSEKNV